MIEINAQNAAEVAAQLKAGAVPGAAKGLAEAMAKVMEHVGYVQKDKRMAFGQTNYTYAGEAAFIAAIRPELVRQQIVVSPVGMEPLAMEVVKGARGEQNRVVLRVTFRFTHAPSGQTLDVVACGEGIDSGDKATNKAMTGAMKYALRQAFVIETGDDPDDTPSHTQERAAPVKPAPDSILRQQYVNQLKAISTRQHAETLWRMYESDVKIGKVSDADRAFLDAEFKQLSKRFPKQTA